MTPKTPIDELSQVRMAIKALREYEADLVESLIKEAGCGRHTGDAATIAIREKELHRIDTDALPIEILNDRKYWKKEHRHTLKVIQTEGNSTLPDPAVVFKGDIVAVARSWDI